MLCFRTLLNSFQKLFRLLPRGRPRILDLLSHKAKHRSRMLEQIKKIA